jgi:hypothetical protein
MAAHDSDAVHGHDDGYVPVAHAEGLLQIRATCGGNRARG